MAEARLTARVETVGVKKATDEFELLSKRTKKAEDAVKEAGQAFLQAEKKSKQLSDALKTATKDEKLAAAAALRLAKEEEDVAKATFKAKQEQLTYAKSLEKTQKDTDSLSESTKKSEVNFAKSANTIKVVITAVVAATAAFSALAIRQAGIEKNFSNLSFLAEETVDDFKALTFATSQVGISAEKFSDISKDINDKLAEFVFTGGGGAKDLFDTLGDSIGFTAQELQQMSGAQTLKAVQNAFESANVPMAQQIFILESLASDASMLIPLLAGNSAELRKLESEYRSVNEQVLISTAQRKDLEALSTQYDLLGVTSSNALSKISAFFSGVLSDEIGGATLLITNATDSLIKYFNTFSDVADIKNLNELTDERARLNEVIIRQEAAFMHFLKFNDKRQLRVAQQQLESSNARLEQISQQINKITEQENAEKKAIFDRSEQEEAAAKEQLRLRAEFDAKKIAQAKATKDELDKIALQGQAEDFFTATGKLNKSPLELIDIEEAEKQAKLESFRTKELESLFLFEEARVAIALDAQRQRDDIDEAARKKNIDDTAATFTELSNLSSMFADTQGGIAKAAFELQKGFNLASAISSVLTAQAQAAADGTALTASQKIGNVALIAGALLPIVAGIKENNFSARQQGGQFSAGQDLLVGEKGAELVRFGSGGRIADAKQTSNLMNRTPSVTIVNQTSGRIDQTQVQTDSRGDMVIIAREVLNREVLDPNSNFSKNLSKTHNIQRSFNNG